MSKLDIPESWAAANLAEVIDSKAGNSKLSKSIYEENGKYVVFSASGPDGRSNTFEEEGSAIILSAIGARCGKCFLANGKWTAIANTAIIRPKIEDDDHLKFIFLILNDEKFWVKGGSAQPFVKLGATKEKSVPMPPLKEQRRIVAKIESTQEKISVIESCTKRAEVLIEKYREALLQKAFRGELVPQDSKDEPASKLLERIRAEQTQKTDEKTKNALPPIKPEEIPFDIPKSWNWVRLGDLLEVLTDYHANGAYEKLKQNVEIKESPDYAIMVRTTNFSDRGRDKFIYVNKRGYDFLEKSKLLPGDLIMNKIADPGTVFLVKDLGAPMTLAMNLFLLRTNECAENRYVFEYLHWSEPYIKSFARGATTKTITKDAVRNLVVPLPPKNEQFKIVEFLAEQRKFLEQTIGVCTSIKSKVNSINQAILQNAFSGKLVQQVFSEGTGYDLLDQIRKHSNESEISDKPMPAARKSKRTLK